MKKSNKSDKTGGLPQGKTTAMKQEFYKGSRKDSRRNSTKRGK